MKPVVRVWPLPRFHTNDGRNEEVLKGLAQAVADTCCGFEDLSVTSTDDIMVQFNQDLMKWGLGDDLMVEITFMGPNACSWSVAPFAPIALSIGARVKEYIQEQGFNPKIRCIWNLSEGTYEI